MKVTGLRAGTRITFEINSELNAGVATTICLPRRHQVKFQKLHEVKEWPSLPVAAYHRPHSRIEELIDFVCQPDGLGHVTTQLDRGVKGKRLPSGWAAMNATREGYPIWLTFIVPPDKFDAFRKQKILKPWVFNDRIRQRILKMPLSSQVKCTIRAIRTPAFRFV